MRALIGCYGSIAAAITGLAPAWACPACFTASEPGVRLGYYLSAAIMSLTPLLIMGVGVGFVALKRSQAQKRKRRNEEHELR